MSDSDTPFTLIGSLSKKAKGAVDPRSQLVKVNPEAITKNEALKQRLAEMTNRIDEIHLAIDNKMDQLSRSRGLTKEKIWGYIQDPKNFTREEWDVIERENKTLFDQVWGIVSITTATPATGAATNRKGKYLGARRKWIPTG